MNAQYSPPPVFPVSIKGVAVQNGRVLLLENERNEWELPGGKIELGEDLIDCVEREIEEETTWKVTSAQILNSWQYHIRDSVDVIVIAYGCNVHSDHVPRLSHEHKRIGLFTAEEVEGLNMPQGYKDAITEWYNIIKT